MLLDVRETDVLRGFHVLAAAALAATALAGCKVLAVTTGHPDEMTAIDAFRFDTDIAAVPIGFDYPEQRVVDLAIVIAEAWPGPAEALPAGLTVLRSLLGFTLPQGAVSGRSLSIVDGNDTAAVAREAARLLSLGPPRTRS